MLNALNVLLPSLRSVLPGKSDRERARAYPSPALARPIPYKQGMVLKQAGESGKWRSKYAVLLEDVLEYYPSLEVSALSGPAGGWGAHRCVA